MRLSEQFCVKLFNYACTISSSSNFSVINAEWGFYKSSNAMKIISNIAFIFVSKHRKEVALCNKILMKKCISCPDMKIGLWDSSNCNYWLLEEIGVLAKQIAKGG